MTKETTGERTHIATKDGYAGGLVRRGEAIPPGQPVGSWMAESKSARHAPIAGSTVTANGRTFAELQAAR